MKDFNVFVFKGNVISLAVAVIIGAAFGAIVSSFVEDIITPLLLAPALKAAGVSDISKLTWGAVKYGNFLGAVIKFLIIAFVLFLVIRLAAGFSKKEAIVSESPSSTDILLTEIRDELRNK